ncbi:hypothetical protein PORY_000551 [Pneumocystis oryctolagi]|uniref:Uncharacterized protein n=1 Tax=Pneumocystis oryctolagi TaxID=42067 RepID=A0ACB7CH80_9ASCO|nr:hypothetical protein PORY_000551 [Pneumocystis oryctolagi]
MLLCVECAHPVTCLYTEYSKNNFRLTQCPLCKRFADKYVEFDYVILAIDVMLIKPQVNQCFQDIFLKRKGVPTFIV